MLNLLSLRGVIRSTGAALLLILSGSSAAWAGSVIAYNDCAHYLASDEVKSWEPEGKWTPLAGKARGIAILVHGLTMNPTKLDPLASELNHLDIATYRIKLRGHNGNLQELNATDPEDWMNELFTEYCHARALADHRKIPLFLMGHSMGGLLVERLLNAATLYPTTKEHIRIDGAVLLAPSIMSSKDAPWAWDWRFALSAGNSLVRNLTHSKPPLQGYLLHDYNEPLDKLNHMVDEADELHTKGFKDSNIPTLILVHSQDPTADLDGYRKIQETFHLTHWDVRKIDSATNSGDAPMPHIIVDQESSGRAWSTELEWIKEYISKLLE